MGFFDPKNVWGTGIEGVMGFPLLTNSGSTQNLWGMRDYGFRGLWDKRASTVYDLNLKKQGDPERTTPCSPFHPFHHALRNGRDKRASAITKKISLPGSVECGVLRVHPRIRHGFSRELKP